MKLKLNITLVFCLFASVCSYGQQLLKVVDQALQANASTEGHTPQWPDRDSDGNRNPEQALIVVKYDGFPSEEIVKILMQPDITNLNKREELTDANGQPITFIYVPLENNNITFSSPYGPARLNLGNLKNKGIYSMTLLVDKKMNIDIEPLIDEESVTVYLDKSVGKSTPARFNGVSLGKHSLNFEFPDGRRETRVINVTVSSDRFNSTTNPDLDLRQLMPVLIESTAKNVTVYVDDVEMSKQAPYTTYVPAGDHTFKVVSNDNERQFDVATAKIEKAAKDVVIKLQPRERKKFEVTASFQDISNVPVMLYVNKEEAYKITEDHAKGERRSFVFDLPVGDKYKFLATYQGNSGKKTITVSPDMAYDQNIIIKKRRNFVWPWEREYIAPPVGLTAGYVQKQYRVKGPEGSFFNGYKGTLTDWNLYDDSGSNWLHGLKVGVQYQPTFGFGLGLYTGLFYEYYVSKTDIYNINKEEGTTDNFSKYQEHNLVLPVEVFYNLPFAKKVALAFHAGLEGNFTLARTFSGWVTTIDGIEYENSYNVFKDGNRWFRYYPGVFTLNWQVGVQLRLGPVMLGAQLTRPISKHKWTVEDIEGEFSTTSIKNSFTLTYVF